MDRLSDVVPVKHSAILSSRKLGDKKSVSGYIFPMYTYLAFTQTSISKMGGSDLPPDSLSNSSANRHLLF
jgi:hypothetical protein